jgi:hypothetical protein
MTEPASPQFLDLKSYRRKRLLDAAKLLTLVGAIILIFPASSLFVVPDSPTAPSATALYLFGVWLVLILCAAFLAPRLQNGGTRDAGDPRNAPD